LEFASTNLNELSSLARAKTTASKSASSQAQSRRPASNSDVNSRLQNTETGIKKGQKTNEMFGAMVAFFTQKEAIKDNARARQEEISYDLERHFNRDPRVEPLSHVLASETSKKQHEENSYTMASRIRILNSYHTAKIYSEVLACEYILRRYIPDYAKTRAARSIGDATKPIILAVPNNFFIIYTPIDKEMLSVNIKHISTQAGLSSQVIAECLEHESKSYVNANRPVDAYIIRSPSDLYDQVIASHVPNPPTKKEFLKEFAVVKEIVKFNREAGT